jgi:hypothetical protein
MTNDENKEFDLLQLADEMSHKNWLYFKFLYNKKFKEAADRIEQLEAALQGLFDNFLELYAKDGCDCDDCEAVRFARAALGEKKDG